MGIVVGCLAINDPKKSSAGSFEVELSADARDKGYFKLTPDKGNVAPGATVAVTCTFERPPPPPRLPGPAGSKGGALEVKISYIGGADKKNAVGFINNKNYLTKSPNALFKCHRAVEVLHSSSSSSSCHARRDRSEAQQKSAGRSNNNNRNGGAGSYSLREAR